MNNKVDLWNWILVIGLIILFGGGAFVISMEYSGFNRVADPNIAVVDMTEKGKMVRCAIGETEKIYQTGKDEVKEITLQGNRIIIDYDKTGDRVRFGLPFRIIVSIENCAYYEVEAMKPEFYERYDKLKNVGR